MFWMNLISELSQTEQDAWYQTMLDYSYDSQEWEKARNVLIQLLLSKNKKAEESAIRSYIACCAEAVCSSMPLPKLSSIVEDFFSRYGMEDAIPQE